MNKQIVVQWESTVEQGAYPRRKRTNPRLWRSISFCVKKRNKGLFVLEHSFAEQTVHEICLPELVHIRNEITIKQCSTWSCFWPFLNDISNMAWCHRWSYSKNATALWSLMLHNSHLLHVFLILSVRTKLKQNCFKQGSLPLSRA